MYDDPTVGDLSEREILRRILDRVGPSRADVGPGDDAAVLTLRGRLVATVDTLVHGPDFRLAWSSGFDLGWKSAAVNLADVAAMGAKPTALLVALAIPDATRISFVEHFADGLRAACDALAPGCAIEGGDLTVSDTLTIAVTALGDLVGPAALRSGARAGDVLALAGNTGLAAHGLDLLFSRFRDASGSSIPVNEAALTADERIAVHAQLRPSPPIGLGTVAAAADVRAMMDVSDGLLLDATRMAEASGVSIDIDPTLLHGDLERSLHGGEDHALLATFSSAEVPAGFRVIGRVYPAGQHAVTVAGNAPSGRGGWDPYRDWDSSLG